MLLTNHFTGSSLLEDEAVVLKDYVVGQRLGEGSYGSVYLATYIPSGVRFALKILQNDCFIGRESKIIQEATVMQSLEHPHVVKMYKFLQSTSSFYFVLELAEKGELFDLVISENYFLEVNARRYFQQLISAIDYCHSKGVAHGDLKAENLLLGENNNLLVCDFGFSSRPQLVGFDDDDKSDNSEILQPIGTLHYTSPEMALRQKTPATRDPFMQDLWSAGIILFFMLTGRLPFDGRDDEETLHLIQTGEFSFEEEEQKRLSESAKSILVRMLALEPTDRPTLQQIIEDEWFGENLDAALFPHRHSLKQSSVFLDFSTQHHVTPEEEAVLEVAFRKIDIDGYGRITRDEVRDMLATLRGERVGAEDVSELIQLFTGNADSAFITYKQFRDTWVKKDLAHRPFRRRNDFQLSKIIGTQMDMVEREVVRQLRLAFDSVDDLHTGAISVDQWKRLFKRCEIKVTEEEIYSLMRFFDERDPSSGSEITFDKFLMGVVKREMLVRHPMGPKLAAATNLAALLQSRKVSECVNHGFFVVGLQNAVVEKLKNCRERLMFMYNDDIASDTENVYSFRYLGSAALLAGTTMESAGPMLASSSGPPSAALGLCTSGDFALSSSLGRGFGQSSVSESLLNNHGISLNNGTLKGNELLKHTMSSSTQAAVSQTHRALAFGGTGAVNQVNGVCDVDVILAPASLGYTLVRFRRIYGKTRDFHEAVAFISSLLEVERQQAMEDTLPRGESELL
ncbi:putative protein kinase [Trypanosoma cruzi]|uniref:Protein kinase, putative n=2 Tax=Trypanosoma cruzi TaxID=5693 RepID=Q4D2S4_TRYCC|nr:protein kinase, putative [Trypanosoma cruzi]EAN86819.1 protein kinase, putative [Trypanosoma cruzi]PWV11173.1 putative protein kinase [Trypanosoma cruzi]|eukprot:XP_808670.1 protein kinase [Trypanosoma cruzi strain CL Brener]